jgi:hypothetical protein
LALIAIMAACSGCGGNADSQINAGTNPADTGLQQFSLPVDAVADSAIPQDSLLPWEELNADGFVDPATARMSSAINENSEFWRGVDAFSTLGTTAPAGQALNVQSGSAGGFGRSSATYRIPLAGENPATLSTDINLYLMDNGQASQFQIGIANYATGRWDFFGGFSDGRIRLPLDQGATGDYISPLGNAFVSIVAYNGSNFDIVGISLNQFDPGDINAPPVPGGLTLSPVAGGLELQWNSVVAADLAGYRIHWSKNSFISAGAAGVQTLSYLEGGTRHVLDGLSGTTFVAICAVDLNGNSSAISTVQSATPLAGDGPLVELQTNTASGIVNDTIALSASGASSYDWDLDGDGVFEVVADNTGSQFADTGKAGIIRPAVRGSDGGTAVALGAVSLIVASDLPPVAILTSNRSSGAISDGEVSPMNVNFNAANSYDDGGSLDYAWGLLGDGNFTPFGPASSLAQDYSSSGMYNAAVRVKDSADQEAYAILPITVKQITGFRENRVYRNPAGIYGALAIVDGRPAVTFRFFAGPDDGLYYSRALDNEGRLWGDPVPIATNPDQGEFHDLAVIDGKPAITYFRFIDSSLCYIRANDSTGQTLASWTNPVVVLEGPVGVAEEPTLTYVSGNPAVLYFDGGDLWYKRATSVAGTGDNAGDWADAAIKIVNANADVRPDLAMIAGNPAIAWRDTGVNEVHYLRATSSTGSSALDWPAVGVKVSAADSCTGRVNLLEVNGAPAISYYEGGINGLKYVRASTATGDNIADWPLGLIIAENFGQGSQYHDMAMISGRPAICYSDFNGNPHSVYRRASNATGSAWGPEMIVAPQANPMDQAFERIDLEDLNGFPGVFLHHSNWDMPVFYTFNTEL